MCALCDRVSRQFSYEHGNVKNDMKMADEWRDAPKYGRVTDFHVVFDFTVLKLHPFSGYQITNNFLSFDALGN